MARFVGMVSLSGGTLDAACENRIRRFAQSNAAGQLKRCHTAVMALWPYPRRGRATPAREIPSGRDLFVGGARLDNRSELGALQGLDSASMAQLSDAALLHAVYGRKGENGIAQALGAFAFAHWNEEARRLTLGRDCLGARALFYHRGDGFVAFASELALLAALPSLPRRLDEAVLANFLALNLSDTSQTFYSGIERVPSRSLVVIEPDRTRVAPYWQPRPDAASGCRRDEDYVARARELFDRAVARCVADTPDVALLMSGGLDSSAVAATLARLGTSRSVTCYCVVPPQAHEHLPHASYYESERGKAIALGQMYPALDIRFVEEGPLHPCEEDSTRYFARAGTMVLNPANLGTFAPALDLIAAAGLPAVLTGSMGNFGLTWSGRYALLALLRRGRVLAGLSEFAALASRQGALRTLAGDILLPALPPRSREALRKLCGRTAASIADYSAINPAYIAEEGLVKRWQDQGYDPGSEQSGWKPAALRARYLFDLNQFARDTGALSRSIWGFEMRDPHADRSLLEFVLAVPEPLYRQRGIARSFARRVLADRLPAAILHETRKGYQGATWFARLDRRRNRLAAEIEEIESSPLARRIIDTARLKRTLAAWPADGAAAEARRYEIRLAFSRAVHMGRFIRWVEGGNAGPQLGETSS